MRAPLTYISRVPKYNGVRAAVVIDASRHRFLLITGENTRVRFSHFPLADKPDDNGGLLTILDGEWCSGTFFTFDAIFVKGECVTFYPYAHRLLLLNKFLTDHDYSLIRLKTRNQFPSDGYIYHIQDGSYYDCVFVKIPKEKNVDLAWYSGSATLYAWCDSTRSLVPVGRSTQRYHASSTDIWTFSIATESAGSGGPLLSPVAPRHDKDRPNSLWTVSIYLDDQT